MLVLRRVGGVVVTVLLAVLTLATIVGFGEAAAGSHQEPPVPAPPQGWPAPAPAPAGRIVVSIVVGDGVYGSEITDTLGPYEVFASSPAFFVYTVSTRREPMVLYGGPRLLPDHTIDEVDGGVAPSPDLVVVPRLDDATGRLTDWIGRQAARGSRILGVCNGARTLAEAGLLDGKRATAYWPDLDEFADTYPAVRWVRGKRYVDEGDITTTAGITSGIPGSLHMVRRLAGTAEAERVGRAVGYPGWSLTASVDIPAHRPAYADTALRLNGSLPWLRDDVGVGLADGMREIDIAAAFDVYAVSNAAHAHPVAFGYTIVTRHGAVLIASPPDDDTPTLERFLVPTAHTRGEADPELVRWATDRGLDIDLPHADRAEGRSGFDGVLRNLAAHADRATARTTAKFIEYPDDHLDLTGTAWPWRPIVLFAAALVLAVGVGMSPHAARRVIRRLRRGTPGPLTATPRPTRAPGGVAAGPAARFLPPSWWRP